MLSFKLTYYKAGVAPSGMCPQVRGSRWVRCFVHFDPPKWLAYRHLRWILRFDHDPSPKTMDRACQVAGAVIHRQIRCPRHVRFGTVSGVCNPYGCADSSFQEVVVSGMQKVTFCLRAVTVFGCGA